jgi:DNA primase
VKAFGLFYCDGGRYANRLVFPVFEAGQFVYYQARAMWKPRDGERYVKVLNPPKQEGAAVSSEVLMNLDQAVQYPRVCITEGPVDCVRAGVDAVCSFGKRLTYAQIARLLRAGVRAIDLLWDADARKEMMAIAPVLGALFDLRLVWLPAGDPAEYTREQLQVMRQQAQPYRSIISLEAV